MAGPLNEAIAAGDWRLFATLRERTERLGRDEVVDAAARFLQAERLTVGRFVPVQA
jgi:hypothetical protein